MQLLMNVCCCFLTAWLVCLTFEVDTTQAQCSKPSGGDNMILSKDHITQESFPLGSKAVFECDVGHRRIRGSLTVTCNDGNKWSKLTNKCIRVSCGFPGQVANGRYDISGGVEFGATATATCDTGYYIVGSHERFCLDAGWSDRVSVCEVVKCETPPVIVHGRPVHPVEELYSYLEVVRYRCDPGLFLNGSSVLYCSETGHFVPAPPTCLDVTCQTPETPANAYQSGGRTPYKHRSSVSYNCDKYYKMEGNPSLTCRSDGNWSTEVPTCTKCPWGLWCWNSCDC